VLALEDVGVPLLARIVQEGVGVHEARPGALATWRARALADLETDRPLASQRHARNEGGVMTQPVTMRIFSDYV
jgi:hypothetical protein